MVDEEVRVRFTADTSSLRRGAKDAKKNLEDVEKKTDDTRSRWQRMADAFSGVSPTFKGITEKATQVGDSISEAFGGGSTGMLAAKLGIAGIAAAFAVVAVKVVSKIHEIASSWAKAFDSKAYDESYGKLQNSVRKLKTTLGALVSPIVNGINTALGYLVDGITWVVKQIYAGLSFVYGFLVGMLEPIVDAFKSLINAISGLFGGGDIFASSAESAEDMAESTEEAGESAEYTSGALASWDKLNTGEDSGGDAATAAELKQLSADMQAAGKAFASSVYDTLGGIADWFSSFDLGGLWDGFCDAAGDAWDWIAEKAGEIWEGILQVGQNIWNGIRSFATTVWTGIQAIATTVWNVISSVATTVWNVISSVASTVWSGIQAVGTTVWNVINTVATTVWNVISSVATTVWNVISSVAGAVWSGIQSVATTVWDIISAPILALWNTFYSVGSQVWAGLQSIGETFYNIIIAPIKSAVDWILDKVEWVLDKISSIKSTLSGITDTLGNIGGSIVSTVTSWIPGLAGGGVVDPGNPQLYVLGDNRVEKEVVSPISTMKQAFKEAMAEAGGSGGSGTVNVTLQMDSRTLARVMCDPIAAEFSRRGRSIG